MFQPGDHRLRGTPGSEQPSLEATGLLAPRPALVVVVWEVGRAFEAGTVGVGPERARGSAGGAGSQSAGDWR